MGGRNHRYTTPGAEGLGWPFFWGGGVKPQKVPDHPAPQPPAPRHPAFPKPGCEDLV